MKMNKNVAFIIMGLFLVLGCENNQQLTTGLTGVVYRGPLNPVEIDGVQNDAPFEAKFYVNSLNNKRIKSFTSNTNGEFLVMLTPGNYKVVPDKFAPILGAEYQIKEITVNAVGITQLDLYFDTGIR